MKINRRTFAKRMIEIFTIIATIVIVPKAIEYATAVRGITTLGGEHLLLLLPLIIILVLEGDEEEC